MVSVRFFMRGIPSHVAFGVVAQYVSVGTISLMFLFGDVAAIPSFALRTWVLLVISSMMGIGISHVLYYVAIHRLGAGLSAAMHLLSPFFTLTLANLLLGEVMGPVDCGAGVVLVLGGATLLRAQGSRQ